MCHHQGSLTHTRQYKRLEVREESLASLLNSLRESMKRIHTEKYAKRKTEAALYYSKQLKKRTWKRNKGQHRPCWWHNRGAKTSLVQYFVFYLLISKFATSYSCAFCIEHCSCNKERLTNEIALHFFYMTMKTFLSSWACFGLCARVYFSCHLQFAIKPTFKGYGYWKTNKQLNSKCKWAMHVFWDTSLLRSVVHHTMHPRCSSIWAEVNNLEHSFMPL